MYDVRVPNWMGIGVVKGGTTSLYHLLKNHPEVYIPASKETHFFVSPEYEKGTEFYLSKYFGNKPSNCKGGDISPKFFIHRDAPRRIREAFGDNLKFILTLRHPVDRAWSHYCHSYERFHRVPYRPTEDLTFEDALVKEESRLAEPDEYSFTHHMWNAYRYTGFYDLHLRNWLKHFHQDNFLFILLDDIESNSGSVIDKITSFLGISALSNTHVFPESNSYSRPNVPTKTFTRLQNEYLPSITRLEKLIDRDLSSWKHKY